MKKHIKVLFLLPFIMSTIGCSNNQNNSNSGAPVKRGPVDVVLISGQSNAVGCTQSIYLPDTMGVDKYNEYFDGYEDIQIAFDSWTKDWPNGYDKPATFYSQNASRKNDFVKVALGQGNGKNTFGPEIGIAEATHEQYGGKLFLIKYACGASNLKDDWLDRKSPMYPRFIEYVKQQMDNLKQKGYEPTIKALCWMQGEGDSYPGYYTVYQDNLRQFVSQVREDLKELAGNKDLPFIDAAIGEEDVWQYPRQVNDAKRAFAQESENNIFIDTIAAGMHTNIEPLGNPDKCHYDSDSQIMLGHLFAEAFKQFLNN